MVEIMLVSGEITLVDDEFGYLSSYVWYRLPGKYTNYARAKINGKWEILHRLIMDTPVGLFVDHIDGNGLNNQKLNLRNVTTRENNIWKNRNKSAKNPYRGVYFHPKTGKWRARICGNGRINPISLGLFHDPETAAKVYDKAAKEYFGEFARLNFPQEGVL